MRHVCIECGLNSPDGNLWCQRADCSALYLNSLFRPGDKLGELEIKALLRVMRTGAIYRARRGGETVLLKVAHTGDMFVDDIKREAGWLYQLWKRFPDKNYPSFLPRIKAPYSGLDLSAKNAAAYGRLAWRDQLRYYLVFDDLQGFFLRDLLNDNPQPQYNYAGWLAISLIGALNFLRGELKVHHFALSPDVIFVRVDEAGVYFPVLFDLGLGQPPKGEILITGKSSYTEWLPRHVAPAYTAPELIEHPRGTEATDVYSIGLVLYEMLAGHPAFGILNAADREVYEAVQTQSWNPLPHKENDLKEVVNRALRHPTVRSPYASLNDFAVGLLQLFGNVPAEKQKTGWWNPRNQQRLMLGLLVLLIGLIVLALPTALATFAAAP